jgi:erythromycin esterase
LDALSPFLKDKQIIGVGEASHGTSEFYKMRQRLFQYGVANWGLKVLALEVQFGAATFLDDYIRTGQGNLTQILKGTGYWIYTTQEFAALMEWMKDYNVGKSKAERLKIYGFDAQAQGAVNSVNWLQAYFTSSAPSFVTAFNEATAFISEGYPEFAQFSTPEEMMAAAPEISQQYQGRINEVITYLVDNQAALTSQSGDATYRLALHHARVLLLAMTQVGMTDFDAAIEYRDNYMAQNVKWISEYENNGKVMALAHNAHIQYAQTAGIKKQDIKWMGYNLLNLYGNRYYAVGFTFNEGGFRASAADGTIQSFTLNPYPGSLTAAFSAQKKPLFFMDIASLSQNATIKCVLDRDYFFYNAEAGYDDNEAHAGGIYNLTESYGGVIYVDKTTPTTGL